jgi:hypothetical protein
MVEWLFECMIDMKCGSAELQVIIVPPRIVPLHPHQSSSSVNHESMGLIELFSASYPNQRGIHPDLVQTT